MTENNIAIYATFFAYLVLMLVIGFFAYRITSSSSDYFLGGRSLGPWPAALSAGASDMSGWLLLGLPGSLFVHGLSSVWIAIGLMVGTWLNWLIMSRRLRTYSIVANDALTIPEFFTNRFKSTWYAHALQVVSAVFILLFFMVYTTSGLVSGGKLFEAVFGLDYHWAVVVGAICVVAYTLFGGFLAVSWTDFVQGLLMAGALVVVPIVIMTDNLGIHETFAKIDELNPHFLSLLTDETGKSLTIIAIVSSLAWGLGYFGQPHILARFQAIRSNKDLPTARRIAVTWTLISMIGAVLVSLAGFVFMHNHPNIEMLDSEQIFMVLVNAAFNPVVAGILLAAVLAAIMSTADSQLLVCSSALSEDIYKVLFRREASQKEIVMVGRITVLVVSIIALSFAMDKHSSVLALVSYAWAGFGAAFGPTLLLCLFWKRFNAFGAIAGVVVGAVTVIVWKLALHGGIFDLYELFPGFLFSGIAAYIVTLLTPEPNEKICEQHEEMLRNL